jgi:hypothetical protein
LSNVQLYYGQPYFFGRYLGGTFGMTAGEVSLAHQNSIKILVIDDLFSSATGYSNGQSQAQTIIASAKSFGVPAGKAIIGDIEASYPVDSGWIQGWYDAFHADGTYSAAYYANPYTGSSGFTTAYCAALSANPQIGTNTFVWSDEPQPGRTTKSNMPAFGPASPSCAGQVPAWQYGSPSSGGQSGANVDTDELKSGLDPYLW